MGHAAPQSGAAGERLDVPAERMPRHIAMIMDGNGRWACQRGLPRLAGHRAGARTVRTVVTECARLGLDALTLYSFSSENWKRTAEEVNGLMELCVEYLIGERREMLDNNIRFRRIGREGGLPAPVLAELGETEAATANCTGLTLVLALDYGSRAEIVDAVRAIAREVRDRGLDPDSIDEEVISARLYTAGLPDPDLLLRTAGEQRISNYLLWQISYSELYVTNVLWPDFDVSDLHEAIRDYAGRSRRFGGLDDAKP
jgi:undecaprenyl diphosphate synthase